MNIAVVVRQVPDLIESLDIDSTASALDWESISFIVNECDDHALEQALLLKEANGGTVSVVAFDFGDVENTLYTAAAKGAERLVKIPCETHRHPSPWTAASWYAQVIRDLAADLVLVGVQAHDEFDGVLAPALATALSMPYLGVIRGVQAGSRPTTVAACKEFPRAVRARMEIELPAVLGILGADRPPRYVPVSRIRNAMNTVHFEEPGLNVPLGESPVSVCRLYPPVSGTHAEMIAGSEAEAADRIADILVEKGLLS